MSEATQPFQLRKIGHVVLNVSDLDAAVSFYTELLGLEVSDRYPDTMVPGGMIFLRCNPDHHGVALVGGAQKLAGTSLNHFAFEVGTPDEVFRAREWLRKHGVPIHFRGAGAPAARSPSSSRIPTATTSRSTGASTRSAPADRHARRASGARPRRWRTRWPIRSPGSGCRR